MSNKNSAVDVRLNIRKVLAVFRHSYMELRVTVCTDSQGSVSERSCVGLIHEIQKTMKMGL